MKRYVIVLIGFFCVVASAAAVTLVVDNDNDFSALERMYEQAPKGHVPGKDNGAGWGTHHPGEECGGCHKVGGRAQARLFTMSGTIYTDRSGSSPLKGGEIIMEDWQGNIISMTGNEVGNFWTTAKLESFPLTVMAHGGPPEPLYELDAEGRLVTPADPANIQSWLYKTWARNKGQDRTMMTIAPVGGASEPPAHMSCSMHHARMGARGALWSSPAPTLPSYPSKDLSYRKHIFPILRSKCSPCHIPGATTTRLVAKSDIDIPSTSIDYSSGLDLMTYEGSVVSSITKQGVLSVVDTAKPVSSVLLMKTTRGGLSHGGGTFWDRSSPDYKALKTWIAEGGQRN